MEQPGKGMDNSPLAEKIRVLLKSKESKEKELKKIEDMLKKENEQIRIELEKIVREIREEEEERFRQENEKRRKQPKQSQTLEQEVEDAPKTTTQINQFGYSAINTQSMLEGNLSVYDLATRQVYDKIKEILDTPEQFRTREEWNILKGVTYNLDKIKREELYLSKKDPNEYVQRTSKLLNAFYK